jgi:hypothetical protein
MERTLARLGGAAALVALLAVGGYGAAAQTPDKDADKPLFNDTFDTDLGSWTAFGPNGKLSLTTDAAHIKNGKGALEFAYKVDNKAAAAQAGNPSGLPVDLLVRPTPDGALTKMRSLRFWARTDEDTPLAVALTEKDGGRYIAFAWLPKNTWQQVMLAPSDFWLSDNKGDPPDPDGKLDLDQVENIGVVSVWSFLAIATSNDPNASALFANHLGPHTLWLDDFTASAAALPETAPAAAPGDSKGVWLEDLSREPLAWLLIGNAQMRREVEGTPLKTPAIQLDYTQAQMNIVVLIHNLRGLDLSKTDRLSFEVASQQTATLIIQLEEKNGAKYNATAEIPAGATATRKTISFTDFTLADDSPPDPVGHLDRAQIKTIAFVDITGILGAGQGKNTLWIGPIRALMSAL